MIFDPACNVELAAIIEEVGVHAPTRHTTRNSVSRMTRTRVLRAVLFGLAAVLLSRDRRRVLVVMKKARRRRHAAQAWTPGPGFATDPGLHSADEAEPLTSADLWL